MEFRDVFMTLMILVICMILLISPQRTFIELRDLFMYPLLLGFFLVTIGDWAFYKFRKKKVKESKTSLWYYMAFMATVLTYPILNMLVDILLTFIGNPVSVEEIFANLLQGTPAFLLFDIIGYPLFIMGSVLVYGSKLFLRSMWSPLVAEIKTDHKLVKNGVYRIVRHPTYGGAVWMIVGQALLLHNPLIVAYDLLVVLPLWYKCANIEEHLLEKMFGEEYRAYRREVPMFFPLLRT